MRPETLGSLVEACRGCRDTALLFRTPFISGKDSLNNEYLGTDGQRHAIPPTLLISSIGVMADVLDSVTMDLKEAGDLLYLVGNFQPIFGGSHFDLVTGRESGEPVPEVHPTTPHVYQALHQAISTKLVRACHDLSEGGLAVAAAEMCIGGRLGVELEMNDVLTTKVVTTVGRALFGETNGCLLVEVSPKNAMAFEAKFTEFPISKIGLVTSDPVLAVQLKKQSLFTIPVADLIAAWNTPLS